MYSFRFFCLVWLLIALSPVFIYLESRTKEEEDE